MNATTNPEPIADSASELNKLMEEARSLIRHAGRTGDAALSDAEVELGERLTRLRAQIDDAQHKLGRSIRHQAEAADRNIREHPYIALGAAAALGLLAGALIARR